MSVELTYDHSDGSWNATSDHKIDSQLGSTPGEPPVRNPAAVEFNTSRGFIQYSGHIHPYIYDLVATVTINDIAIGPVFGKATPDPVRLKWDFESNAGEVSFWITSRNEFWIKQYVYKGGQSEEFKLLAF